MKVIFSALFVMIPILIIAQIKPAVVKKNLCNPLVIGSIPKKALSFQYELQSSFSNNYSEKYGFPITTTPGTINNVQGLRLNYYKNIITKPKAYVTLDMGYWHSKYAVSKSSPASIFINDFNNNDFHSFTASTNIFKPISAKNFILINASVELNGNGKSFKKIGVNNIFAGGAIIYGWKKGFSSMVGVGILRAYRLGRVIHIPAFLMNKNFSPKWGIEMLLPARAVVRYTPNKKNIFTAGFDLEGGQFAYASNNAALNNTFFQRGEIRPKLGWETALGKNTRFTANTGLRINGRMDLASKYDGKHLVVENMPATNFFVNVGFHIVNLKTMAKKK